MSLITLSAARLWLRVGSEISDADLQDLIDDAAAYVADFMGRPIEGDDGWPDGAVPKVVSIAIKAALVAMYDNREAPVINEDVMYALVGRYCITGFA